VLHRGGAKRAAEAVNAGLSQAGIAAQPEGGAKRSIFTQIELVKPDVNGSPPTIPSDRMSVGLAFAPVIGGVIREESSGRDAADRGHIGCFD
jgi:hypothetical protein